MIWLAVLKRFWLPLVAAGAVIGAGWYLHHRGYESGYAASEKRWQAAFAKAAAERDAANAKALRQETESTLLSDQIGKQHAEQMASLNLRAADADKRIRALSVRLAAASSCRVEVPAVSGTSAEPDDATEGVRRAAEAGGRIAAVGTDCEADAARLAALQRWITEQRAIFSR